MHVRQYVHGVLQNHLRMVAVQVADHLDEQGAIPVLANYFKRAAELAVGSDTWYIGLSNSAPCLGEGFDLLADVVSVNACCVYIRCTMLP